MLRNNLSAIKGKIVVIFILLILLCGCDNKSPTAPTTTTSVAPTTLNFYASLVSDIANPPPRSVSLRLWNNENKKNVLAIKIRANGVTNANTLEASLGYDPDFLSPRFNDFKKGDFFERAGAQVNYKVRKNAFGNGVNVDVQIMDDSSVSGSGAVVCLKFDIKKSGTTNLKWHYGKVMTRQQFLYSNEWWCCEWEVGWRKFYGAKITITKR